MKQRTEGRFGSRSMEIMHAIQTCNPKSNRYLDPTSLKPLIDNYSMDHPSVTMEAKQPKYTLASGDKCKELEWHLKATLLGKSCG